MRIPPASPALSASQLERLRELGEEGTAEVGDVLYRVGDRVYPFIAIVSGEVAIIDAAGSEIIRHGQSGFLGEMNLLTGQTVFVTAVVTKPLRYVAVERDVLRALLFEDGPLSDLVLATFMERREALEQVDGIGIEIVGPRSSVSTMQLLDFARSNHLPYTWQDAAPPGDGELPLVRLPGGTELRGPSTGEVSRALGIGLELAAREEVDLVVVGGGPAGLGAAVYGASEGLDTLVVEGTALGGQAGSSRRIENYLGFPAGITGAELTGRAVTQARKFAARTATPYRAVALEPGRERHVVRLEEGQEIAARAVLLATGAEYRRLPVAALAEYEGLSVFYAAGPPEGRLCAGSRVAVVGGGNSAGQAAVWLSRGGALVSLLHRRAGAPGDDVCVPHSRARPRRCCRSRPQRDRRAPRRGRNAGSGDAEERRASAVLVSLLLPGRASVHRLARGCRRAGRARIHPHRRRRGRGRPARDERAGYLRSR